MGERLRKCIARENYGGNTKENHGGKEITSDSMLNPSEEMKKLKMENK